MIELKSNQSIYLQISDFIYENILNGTFGAETKIPSVREMAAQVGVNPNTVMRSYAQLQEEGIIFNKRGIGVFVSADASGKIKKKLKSDFLKYEMPEIIKKMKMLDIDFLEFEKLFKQ